MAGKLKCFTCVKLKLKQILIYRRLKIDKIYPYDNWNILNTLA